MNDERMTNDYARQKDRVLTLKLRRETRDNEESVESSESSMP